MSSPSSWDKDLEGGEHKENEDDARKRGNPVILKCLEQ